MIKTEDHLSRRFDHRALNINEQAMRICDAFERNTPCAHNRNIGMNLGKCLHSKGPYQNPKPRINHSTGYNHFESIGGSIKICHRKRVGNDLWRLALKIASDMVNRRARVDYHGL